MNDNQIETARLRKIVEKARDKHHRDGEVEIDDIGLGAEGELEWLSECVSEGDDGAYIRAWVFVSNEEME